MVEIAGIGKYHEEVPELIFSEVLFSISILYFFFESQRIIFILDLDMRKYTYARPLEPQIPVFRY